MYPMKPYKMREAQRGFRCEKQKVDSEGIDSLSVVDCEQVFC